jgi:hypothetical protein
MRVFVAMSSKLVYENPACPEACDNWVKYGQLSKNCTLRTCLLAERDFSTKSMQTWEQHQKIVGMCPVRLVIDSSSTMEQGKAANAQRFPVLGFCSSAVA